MNITGLFMLPSMVKTTPDSYTTSRLGEPTPPDGPRDGLSWAQQPLYIALYTWTRLSQKSWKIRPWNCSNRYRHPGWFPHPADGSLPSLHQGCCCQQAVVLVLYPYKQTGTVHHNPVSLHVSLNLRRPLTGHCTPLLLIHTSSSIKTHYHLWMRS